MLISAKRNYNAAQLPFKRMFSGWCKILKHVQRLAEISPTRFRLLVSLVFRVRAEVNLKSEEADVPPRRPIHVVVFFRETRESLKMAAKYSYILTVQTVKNILNPSKNTSPLHATVVEQVYWQCCCLLQRKRAQYIPVMKYNSASLSGSGLNHMNNCNSVKSSVCVIFRSR